MRMTSGFELGGAFRILASSCPLFDLRPRMLVSHRFKFVGRLRGEHLVVFRFVRPIFHLIVLRDK